MAKQVSDTSEYRALKKALADGTVANFYIFPGKEDYLREYYLDSLKKKLVGGMEDFNCKKLEGVSLTVADLQEAVDALPVFAERTVVEVRDFDIYKCGENQKKQLMELIADVPEYCCLVLVYDTLEFKPDARTKLHGEVKKHCRIVEFAEQDQSDLTNWIRRRFAALNKDIDVRDAEYLVFLCGSLMTGLISEIEKVGAYAKGRVITRADIDAVATPVIDAVAFRMTDAISKKDFDRAGRIMGDLLALRESPIMLLAMIGKQMRQLYFARLAMNEKKNAAWVQKQLALRSSYQASALWESARRFSLAWCRKAVLLCADTDRKMKSSGEDNEELLKLLLLKLAAWC